LIIDLISEFLDGVLVGYISNHYGSSGVVLNVLRYNQVKAPLLVGLVVVVVVISLSAIISVLVISNVGVDVRMNIDCAGVTFRK
jgi:hypothetical protein